MIRIIICPEGLCDSYLKQVCHIICAGEYSPGILRLRSGGFVIAADGGLRHLETAGLAPDIVIGDFDSLGYVPDAGNVIRLCEEKDETDTMAAVRLGLETGYHIFYIHCGMGGRLDHTLANIQTLAFIQRNGGFGILFGKGAAAVLVDKAIEFSADMKGYVSVFSYTRQVYGINIEGLKYGLTDAVLDNAFPLGVSNEFIGRKSRITVQEGCALVIFEN